MRLNFYIARQMLVWLLISTVSLIGIVWLSHALRMIELIVNKGANMIDFLLLTVLAIPLWIVIILPFSGLFATLFILNKLQQDREITAMRSIGMSNLFILRGPVLVGLLMTGFLYVNSAVILPLTYSSYKNIITTLRTSAPIVVIQEGVFTDITKGLTIFVKEREGKYDFSHIFVHDNRDEEKKVEVVAESGSILINATPPKIIFNNGTRSEFTEGQSQAAVLEFDRYALNLTSDEYSGGARPLDHNEMSIAMLLTETHAREHFVREMRAEGHFRLASPLLGLAMVLIAAVAILNSQYSRMGSWKMILTGIAAGLGCIILTIISRSLAVTYPVAFPLIYLSAALPLVVCTIMMIQPHRLERVTAS
ncbi:MAG: LptF/LptG family permease [Candidatus Puniceispirillales bacterium]